jgi:hypothetical protein
LAAVLGGRMPGMKGAIDGAATMATNAVMENQDTITGLVGKAVGSVPVK